MNSGFETVLELVGSYGRFQKKQLVLVLVPITFLASMTANLVFFQLIVPEYWCSVPGRGNSQFSMKDWKSMTIPKAIDGSFEKCLQYGLNITEGTNHFFITNVTNECLNGYDHDRSLFWETAATDMEWLCKKEKYSTHIIALNLAGNAAGSLLLPLLADGICGRKTMYFISVGISIIFNLALLIWHQFYFMAVFIFFIGFSPMGASNMSYVTIMELINSEHRTITSFCSFVAWTFGMCFAALVAFLVPHWWYLILISGISSVISIGLGRNLPESPRWLLSKGKLEQCVEILIEVAKSNGKQGSCEVELKRKLQIFSEKEKMSKIPITEVLKFPKICRNGIITSIIGSMTWLTYACVLLKMDLLPNSHFLNFFILSIIELPSNVIAWLSIDYLGRRMTSFLTYAAATFFTVLSLIYVRERVVLLCMVAFVKLFSTEGVYVVYTMATEIFPTPIRSTGVGIVIITANLTAMISPYIINVGETFLYSVLIIINVICMLLSPFLPETLGLPLPQTLQDAETLAQDRPFWKWVHYLNQNKEASRS